MAVIYALVSSRTSGMVIDNQYIDPRLSIGEPSNSVTILHDGYIMAISSPSLDVGRGYMFLGERAIYPTSSKIFLPGDEYPYSAGQCVNWVKYHTKLQIIGNAIAWADYVNSTKPLIGSVIVLDIGRHGHVGIVIDYDNESVTYRSRNQNGLWVISDTKIDKNSSEIVGYIKR